MVTGFCIKFIIIGNQYIKALGGPFGKFSYSSRSKYLTQSSAQYQRVKFMKKFVAQISKDNHKTSEH